MIRFTLVALVVVVLAACASGGGEARRAINSQLPARPYSEAVQVGDTYFFSGKIGVTSETRGMIEGRTGAEVRNVMEAFRELFGEVGVSFSDVVMATVFLVDMDDYGQMNEAYGEYFDADPPARETVAVQELVAGAQVEISFIAVKR